MESEDEGYEDDFETYADDFEVLQRQRHCLICRDRTEQIET